MGLGLTLTDYLRMQVRADQKFYESKEGTAKSVIFIFLAGWHEPSGVIRSQAVGSD